MLCRRGRFAAQPALGSAVLPRHLRARSSSAWPNPPSPRPGRRQPRAPTLSATAETCAPALPSPAPAGRLRPPPARTPGGKVPPLRAAVGRVTARARAQGAAGGGGTGRGAAAAARGASGTGSGAWYLGVLLSQLLVLPLQLRGGRHGPASSGRTRPQPRPRTPAKGRRTSGFRRRERDDTTWPGGRSLSRRRHHLDATSKMAARG